MSDHGDHSDPILRALRDGDEACPDGRALVAVGRIVREAATPPDPVDLVASVRAGCASLDRELSEDQLVDEFYDGDAAAAAADPALQRLGELLREAATPEDEVDLLPRLEGRFGRLSSRRAVATDVDGATRWRIWTAVIVGHVAAFLALAIFNVRMSGGIGDEQQVLEIPRLYRMDTSDIGREVVPRELDLPATWSDLSGHPEQLLALRGEARLREEARRRYAMTAASGTVEAALAWLQHRQDAESGAIGSLTGRVDLDLAVQSLAALALVGEGVDDSARRAAADRLLTWLAEHADKAAATDATVDGLLALALVEGALLLERDDLRRSAEEVLAEAARDPGIDRGRGGMLVIAAEIAALNAWEVPTAVRAAAVDPVDLGVRTHLQQIREGLHPSMGSVTRILAQPLAADAEGRLDLLGWIAATMAVREVGGLLWNQWADELHGLVLPHFAYTPDGQAWPPGERVRHAGVTGPAADVFATSLAIILLQTPYRYLPLAH